MPLSSLPSPSLPALQVPIGACDCHAHVFGPYDDFPLAGERTYTPAETPVSAYQAVLMRLGFSRGVLVQPSAHGLDNGALLAALGSAPGQLRGVAVAQAGASLQALWTLKEAGVRGLRFSRLLDARGAPKYANAVDVAALDDLAPKMREVGLHAQLWLGNDDLEGLLPLVRSAGIPFVIDHLGRCDPAQGFNSAGFRLMCDLVESGKLWVKLTPYRTSRQFPQYDDMRPFHQRLTEINPDRLLWGSDWPHVNMARDMPDAGRLLDTFAEWTGDSELISRILVRNPAALYGF